MIKVTVVFLAAALAALPGCTAPEPPVLEQDTVGYSIECSRAGITADISYTDGSGILHRLEAELLPWSFSFSIDYYNFGGRLMLKANIPESVVFRPYAAGNATAAAVNALVDDSADFYGLGTAVGDILYCRQYPGAATTVEEVENIHRLELGSHLVKNAGDDYSLYHVEILSCRILLNGSEAASDSDESERLLDVLAQYSADR